MTRTTHLPTTQHRPPETLPELDSLSLLTNPWLDRDSETVDWLAERESALLASESGEGRGQV